jgi:rubrerythrin
LLLKIQPARGIIANHASVFGANRNHQAATKRIQTVEEAGPDNEILEFAIAREMDAYRLFMVLAGRAASPQMRKVFEDLAQEELGHKEKLELEIMKTGQTVPAISKFNNPDREYIIPENQLKPDMDYKDMLLLGIKKEEESFRIYIDLLQRVQDKESRKVLLALAEEEVKHKLRFEIEYDRSLKKSMS